MNNGKENLYEKNWKKFINGMEMIVKKPIITWNKNREYIMRDDRKNNQIFLKEIEVYECEVKFLLNIFLIIQNPLTLVEESYHKDKFEENLLIKEIKPIKNIFDIDSTSTYIIEKKEKMEISKKLIESFLNFLVKENFVKISKKNLNYYIN